MLYRLLYPFHTTFSVLNVTGYITFRTAAASLTAMAIGLVLGPWLISGGVSEQRCSRAGLLCDCGLRIAEFFPHDDNSEGEQHGIDDADGCEFETGDLIVLDQCLDPDPTANEDLRAHGQRAGKHDE